MSQDAPFEPGFQIGNYEIISLLGHGGMGGVYLVRHVFLQKRFALKVLNDELAALPEFTNVFRHEARTLATLRHPHIVQVHDFGMAGERHYFVMDYVKGGTLDTLRRERGGRLPPDEALTLLRAIASALAHAHSMGIVHRDIKPENLLVDAEGVVRVTDFGLARLTRPPEERHAQVEGGGDTYHRFADQAKGAPELTGGTEGFIAPEVKAGASGDTRSDIYALGVLARLLLTGKAVAPAMKPLAALVPGLDPRWDTIVNRCLAAEPDERYADGAALEEALNELAPAGRSRRRARTPIWVWMLPAPILALTAFLVLLGAKSRREAAAAAPAPAPASTPAVAPRSETAAATPLPLGGHAKRENTLRPADAVLGYGLHPEHGGRLVAGWKVGSSVVWKRPVPPGHLRLSTVYEYTPELGAKPARIAVRIGESRLRVYLPASISPDTPMLAYLGEIEVTSAAESVEVELVEGPAGEAHLSLGALMLDSAPPPHAAP